MSITADNFTMVPESEFGLKHLRLHPVWARYFEPDDIDVACSWGVDRGVFLDLLEQLHDGSDHAFFPVLALNPLPDDELDIYAKALFTSFSGVDFQGYISADACFCCLYIDDATYFSFTTNRGLKDLTEATLEQVHQLVPDVDLFPLRYSSSFELAAGSKLVGEFIV